MRCCFRKVCGFKKEPREEPRGQGTLLGAYAKRLAGAKFSMKWENRSDNCEFARDFNGGCVLFSNQHA